MVERFWDWPKMEPWNLIKFAFSRRHKQFISKFIADVRRAALPTIKAEAGRPGRPWLGLVSWPAKSATWFCADNWVLGNVRSKWVSLFLVQNIFFKLKADFVQSGPIFLKMKIIIWSCPVANFPAQQFRPFSASDSEAATLVDSFSASGRSSFSYFARASSSGLLLELKRREVGTQVGHLESLFVEAGSSGSTTGWFADLLLL